MNVLPVNLELPGRRARLEPLSLSHVPDLAVAGDDEEAWRYSTEGWPRGEAAMRGFVERALSKVAGGTDLPFAIIDRQTGRAAGSTRYLDIQPSQRSLEIGWTWLGAAWRRTSINTECKYLLLRHAFESLGAVRVQLKADARNQRSRQAMERIGAVYEGTLRRHRILPDGAYRDSAYYSVLDREWPAVKARLEGFLNQARP